MHALDEQRLEVRAHRALAQDEAEAVRELGDAPQLGAVEVRGAGEEGVERVGRARGGEDVRDAPQAGVGDLGGGEGVDVRGEGADEGVG